MRCRGCGRRETEDGRYCHACTGSVPPAVVAVAMARVAPSTQHACPGCLEVDEAPGYCLPCVGELLDEQSTPVVILTFAMFGAIET